MEDWELREIAEACVKECDTDVLMDWATEYLIRLYKEHPPTLKDEIERFGTVAQWLERRSYKSVAEGSIPSSPTLSYLFL